MNLTMLVTAPRCGSWNARSGRFLHLCGPTLRRSMRARCFKEAVETVAFAEKGDA